MWLHPNFYQSLRTDMGGSAEQPRAIWCEPRRSGPTEAPSTLKAAWPKQRAEETSTLSSKRSLVAYWALGTRADSEDATAVSVQPRPRVSAQQ